MPHMTTYGAQMDRKWTRSGAKWTGSEPEVPSVCHSICLSVCLSRSGLEVSVRPKHFPYLLDEPYARELQAQGACALRFFKGNFYVRICTVW